MDKLSDINNKEVQETDGNEAKALNQKRRALTKAALAAPVIGALASRPALGQGRVCTVSVLMSGDGSIPIDYDTCVVCSPGFWFAKGADKSCYWPTAFPENSTSFSDVFTVSVYNSDPLITQMLTELSGYLIVNFDSSNKNDFFKHYGNLGGHVYKNIAEKLFMFCRAASAGFLNAKTLGVIFPDLLGQAIHSVDDIQDMVTDVFKNNLPSIKTTSENYASQISADWGGMVNDEIKVCSMFGSCK